jgi:hypothetical protein
VWFLQPLACCCCLGYRCGNKSGGPDPVLIFSATPAITGPLRPRRQVQMMCCLSRQEQALETRSTARSLTRWSYGPSASISRGKAWKGRRRLELYNAWQTSEMKSSEVGKGTAMVLTLILCSLLYCPMVPMVGQQRWMMPPQYFCRVFGLQYRSIQSWKNAVRQTSRTWVIRRPEV